jgi:phosphoglycolate phosphatase-like HAD superfamily hydrolase
MRKQRSDVRAFEGSEVREHPNPAPERETPEHPNASSSNPKILALDFDGVLCNSVYEGMRSAWRVYRDIWDGSGDTPPPQVADAFVRLRPAMEIGWEFPVMLRALVDGVSETTLAQEFQATWRQRIVERYKLNPKDLTARFDGTRDEWIGKDLDSWLGCQNLYAGIAGRLNALLKSEVQMFVITTKEGKYARLILERNGVPFPAERIWGKERARPKTDLLRILHREHGVAYADIWFVEDRLKTLQSAKQQVDLGEVGLFLAAWGYNTPGEQDEARADKRIALLTLEQFCGAFSAWKG